MSTVLVAVERAYKEGCDFYRTKLAIEEQQKEREAENMRMKNCPSKTDKRCKEILSQLYAHHDRNIYELDVDDRDLEYAMNQMSKYWGEDKIKTSYPEVLTRLSRNSINHNLIDDDNDDDQFDSGSQSPKENLGANSELL